jgi:hypothetical protein
VIIYPRLAQYSIINDSFVPDDDTIREIWKAKELGFKGQLPETRCGKKCAHHRLRIKLPEGNLEPLPPLPLIFSKGVSDTGFSFDVAYQVSYAWSLLPINVRLAIEMSVRHPFKWLRELKDWLREIVGLDQEPVDIVSNPVRREAFLRTKPEAEGLMKSMSSELEPWIGILGKRVKLNCSSILAIGTAIYSLPKGSQRFVTDACDWWN